MKNEKKGESACAACLLPEKDAETVEKYLVEVVDRLYDVMMGLDGLIYGAQMEKGTLVQKGGDFRYQQAVIDIANELRRYATGEESIREVMKVIEKQRKVMQEAPAPVNGVAGYT